MQRGKEIETKQSMRWPLKGPGWKGNDDDVVVVVADAAQRRLRRQWKKNRMPTVNGIGIRERQQQRRFEAMNRVYNS